jgi:hypothetical protein
MNWGFIFQKTAFFIVTAVKSSYRSLSCSTKDASSIAKCLLCDVMRRQFQGPKNASKYYIACQAPIAATVIDFWLMIWEQQSKVILMLTDLVENGVVSTSRHEHSA